MFVSRFSDQPTSKITYECSGTEESADSLSASHLTCLRLIQKRFRIKVIRQTVIYLFVDFEQMDADNGFV